MGSLLDKGKVCVCGGEAGAGRCVGRRRTRRRTGRRAGRQARRRLAVRLGLPRRPKTLMIRHGLCSFSGSYIDNGGTWLYVCVCLATCLHRQARGGGEKNRLC